MFESSPLKSRILVWRFAVLWSVMVHPKTTTEVQQSMVQCACRGPFFETAVQQLQGHEMRSDGKTAHFIWVWHRYRAFARHPTRVALMSICGSLRQHVSILVHCLAVHTLFKSSNHLVTCLLLVSVGSPLRLLKCDFWTKNWVTIPTPSYIMLLTRGCLVVFTMLYKV